MNNIDNQHNDRQFFFKCECHTGGQYICFKNAVLTGMSISVRPLTCSLQYLVTIPQCGMIHQYWDIRNVRMVLILKDMRIVQPISNFYLNVWQSLFNLTYMLNSGVVDRKPTCSEKEILYGSLQFWKNARTCVLHSVLLWCKIVKIRDWSFSFLP